MKKFGYVFFLLICCCFIIFFLFKSISTPDKIASISGWVLLAYNPLIKAFPKIKLKLMVMLAKLVNYKTELKFGVRIYVDQHFDYLGNLNQLSTYQGFRKICYPDKIELDFEQIKLDFIEDEDSVFLSFNTLKIGYRDVLKEMKHMELITESIINKVIKSYEETIFECTIDFEEHNPYLNILISDRVKSKAINVDISTNNMKITNTSIHYHNDNLMKFSQELENELLLN